MSSSKESKFQNIMLWPGDMICRLFGVKQTEERFFLRLYLNIFIYTKVFVGIAVLLALWDLGFFKN